MATSNDNVITYRLSGTIGKELVFRQWAGKTIVSKAPKAPTGPTTPAQALTRERFFLASRYAKSVLEGMDQGIRDAYNKALKPRQNLYSRALADFMSAPVVQQIDGSNYTGAAHSIINIRAIDDFRVTMVRVEIYATSGILLEKGHAVQQPNGVDWTYTATMANDNLHGSIIKAVATDVPGNEGRLESRV